MPFLAVFLICAGLSLLALCSILALGLAATAALSDDALEVMER